MFEINRDVVFVPGAVNGAIYSFQTKRVYSVNHRACEIIDRYIRQMNVDTDSKYLTMLQDQALISDDFLPHPFQPILSDTPKLEMAWLEITEFCNLRCLHCYEGSEHKKAQNGLSLDQWYETIKQLADLGINRLIIIGGEPCCHPDIIDILEYATQFQFDITLFTNATCFTDELFDCVIRNDIKVKVSIYGHCAEIHDLVTTVPGSFEKMCCAIKRLVNNGVTVYSAVIIMKENQDHLDEIIKFVKEMDVKYSRYDVIRQVYGGSQCSHIPTDTKLIDDVSFTSPNFNTTKTSFCNNCFHNSCWYGKITICENGDVLPCEFARDIKYGNVANTPIAEIIADVNTRAKWDLDFSQINECRDCEFRFACHDCRPLSKAVHGDLFSKNPRCWYDVYAGVWQKS